MNFHGGDIYNYNNGNILDFSSNINPLGVPESFKKALAERIMEFTRYPDISYSKLRRNIAEYLGLRDADGIIPGNGAVELIYKTVGVLPCKKIYTVSPTFSEYGRGVALSGKSFVELPLFDDGFQSIDFDRLLDMAEDNSLVVICNPNNPTGTLTDKATMCRVAAKLSTKGCWLMIDEAFIEFTEGYPETSMISELCNHENLIVVRAVTKYFGMPGIRLGYAVSSNSNIISCIGSSMEPWNINTAAVIAAETVLCDSTYIERTRKWLSEERFFLYKELKDIKGLRTYKSQANFHLCRIEVGGMDAWSLKREMVDKGVLIRTPDGFGNLTDRHIRLAIKDRNSNLKLISVLKEVLAGEK